MFIEYILDSAAEWHALEIGLALGVTLGLAIAFGRDAIAAAFLGYLAGIVTAMWHDGLLVWWPARRHAWYLILPSTVLAATISYLLLETRQDPDA